MTFALTAYDDSKGAEWKDRWERKWKYWHTAKSRNGQLTIAAERYRYFDIPAQATHSLRKEFRKELLLNSLKLDAGENCLEIGCGIPKLSLDMAAISGATVLMLDLRKCKAPWFLLTMF